MYYVKISNIIFDFFKYYNSIITEMCIKEFLPYSKSEYIG